jgi:hypothetical protein
MNYLYRLASNLNPLDLSLPNSHPSMSLSLNRDFCFYPASHRSYSRSALMISFDSYALHLPGSDTNINSSRPLK